MATKNHTKNPEAKLAFVWDPTLEDKRDKLTIQFYEETRANFVRAKALLLSLPARKQRTKRVVKDLAMVRGIIRLMSTFINSRRSGGVLVPRQQ